MTQETVLWKPVAVVACAAMAFFYVGILHAPSLILRLPRPSSYNEFMIRRFICAGISSIGSIIFCAMILPIRSWEASYLLGIYGIRLDHTWRAVVLPLSLTSLMYAGSFVLKSFLFVDAWRERINQGGGLSPNWIKDVLQNFLSRICSTASSVLAWRTYVVAPLTEELVFRACMIPLFLCGGIQIYSVIFLCPILFSLAHLNHWMEIYSQQNYSLLKASLAVGFQLGYTVIFGAYASFLFIRTGHFLAPFTAHVFCNFMGLPVLLARGKGIVTVAFVAGMLTFFYLLFPLTQPDLYNDRTNSCRCWNGYCARN